MKAKVFNNISLRFLCMQLCAWKMHRRLKKVYVLLTTCISFISPIVAILVSITQFGFFYALGCGIGAALGTDKFVFRASDGGAIGFVRAIRAIFVAIAMPAGGNTTMIFTSELTTMTWRKIWNRTAKVLWKIHGVWKSFGKVSYICMLILWGEK